MIEAEKAALAHVAKDEAEAAYARSDIFEKRRRLMEDWSQFLRQNVNKIIVMQL